tara:strand:+ start:9549 stop:10007 length:459 start_codon:yes stop_codon:yes gene_type:complete
MNEPKYIKIQIRKIKCKDYYKGCLELLSQYFTINPSLFNYYSFKKYVKAQRRNNYHIFVGEFNNHIIAITTCYIETKLIHNFGKVAHIEDVIVDEAYRGYKIGTQLIDACIHYAYTHDCYKILLNCDKDKIPFYEKCKFNQKCVCMAYYCYT